MAQQMTRRGLLFIHRWAGLTIGAYALAIGLSGSLLVFRQDLQAWRYPQFFAGTPSPTAAADVAAISASLGTSYSGYTISGFDWPTYRRGTFLAYVVRGTEFKTVFVDPSSGRVIGEMPYDWIRWVQDLHFTLLAGEIGALANGIGAAFLLLMCVTGVVIWWPGLARWLRHLRVSVARGWRRAVWELHGAIGIWAWLWLTMWALTGVYFSFSQPFREAVNAISPLTVVRAPESAPASVGSATAIPETLLQRALEATPDARPARLVMPFGDRGTFQVVLAREVHGDWDTTDEVTFYFDRYSGRELLRRDHRERTAGDALMSWIGPVHVGSLWGLPFKLVWASLGLAFPLLFMTGVVIWTTRAGRTAGRR
jgi:uncharacterized iron-regulated membrane protein